MALPHPDKNRRSLTPDEEQERRRIQRAKNQTAIELLDQLMNVGDAEAAEQRDTLDYLERVLNEDRLSDRDRFPSR